MEESALFETLSSRETNMKMWRQQAGAMSGAGVYQRSLSLRRWHGSQKIGCSGAHSASWDNSWHEKPITKT
jgi:hypothetical protein